MGIWCVCAECIAMCNYVFVFLFFFYFPNYANGKTFSLKWYRRLARNQLLRTSFSNQHIYTMNNVTLLLSLAVRSKSKKSSCAFELKNFSFFFSSFLFSLFLRRVNVVMTRERRKKTNQKFCSHLATQSKWSQRSHAWIFSVFETIFRWKMTVEVA